MPTVIRHSGIEARKASTPIGLAWLLTSSCGNEGFARQSEDGRWIQYRDYPAMKVGRSWADASKLTTLMECIAIAAAHRESIAVTSLMTETMMKPFDKMMLGLDLGQAKASLRDAMSTEGLHAETRGKLEAAIAVIDECVADDGFDVTCFDPPFVSADRSAA